MIWLHYMSDPVPSDAPKFTPKKETFERVNGPMSSAAESPRDVHEILRRNKAAADILAEPLDLTPRKSRRFRDYLAALVVGNAAIGGLIMLLPTNAVTLAFLLSGAELYSIGVSWVIWIVMDDY